MQRQVWVISELYYPEETSTGYLLTQTAEGLANEFPVRVLCSQPTYSARGRRAPTDELHNGVTIHRCWSTTFDKDAPFLRLANMVTITLSIFFNLLWRIQAGDCVLVVTNPPALPFAVNLACFLRQARCILIIHDVYPEVLVATGISTATAFLTQVTGWLTRRLYRQTDRIVVLGRDMKRLVQRKLRPHDQRVAIIENWADLDLVAPQVRSDNALLSELGLTNSFVIQYAGNMGRTHGIEHLVSCARQLASHPHVHFLFIGSGAKKAWLEQTIVEERLPNITVLPNRLRSDQSNFLNACDIAVISFVPGMAGVSVPSRMYNILAAGKPLIAVADPDSELACVVHEEKIGWVVAPDDQDALQQAVIEAATNASQLKQIGCRARQAAESKYSLTRANQAYADLVHSLYEQASR